MRRCSKCELEKPLSEFYPKRRKAPTPDGWGSICKVCAVENVLAWYKSNAGRSNERTRQWYKENKGKHAASVAKWAKKNVHKRNHASALRRAKRFHATPIWANEFFISEAYHLARLRTKKLGFKWHVDHIVPLKSDIVCGLHVESNLQVIPAIQNLQKHNRIWPDMPAPPA